MATTHNSRAGYDVGDLHAEVTWVETRDWNAYSRAWHRRYGPKVTETSRMATVTQGGRQVACLEFLRWPPGRQDGAAAVALAKARPGILPLVVATMPDLALYAQRLLKKGGHRCTSSTSIPTAPPSSPPTPSTP